MFYRDPPHITSDATRAFLTDKENIVERYLLEPNLQVSFVLIIVGAYVFLDTKYLKNLDTYSLASYTYDTSLVNFTYTLDTQ